jgi:S-adenosylmethionine-diacylglycerol 3-amino-3-carboxypropyl transferase
LSRNQGLAAKVHAKIFNGVCSRSLIYNTCWEDPAVDRVALEFAPDDDVLVITSAGCNAIDYALAGPRRVYAVDANPAQNALLELKLAGVRALPYEDFFQMFGTGRHPDFPVLYARALREQLSAPARQFWDARRGWFSDRARAQSFYFRGLSGTFARGFRAYCSLRPQLKEALGALLSAPDLNTQQSLYDREVAPRLWHPGIDWTLSQPLALTLLGVPGSQHDELKRLHPRGVAGFVRDAIDYVCRQLPLATNYFWQLYVRGHYTPECCPEYLKRENFVRLADGIADRIEIHTSTVAGFLQGHPGDISKFVLLDHMDWMDEADLAVEWSSILARARPGARVIFRSAHVEPWYLERLRVPFRGERTALRDLFRFLPELAHRLSVQDRVHTYGGFHIGVARA